MIILSLSFCFFNIGKQLRFWLGGLRITDRVLIFISKWKIMDISLAWCHGCFYFLITRIKWVFASVDLASKDIVYQKISYITVNYLFIKPVLFDGNFLNGHCQM